MRKSPVSLISNHRTYENRAVNPAVHRYREMNLWAAQASGNQSAHSKVPSRAKPRPSRFNPEGVTNTKGTSADAWKWWFTHYPFLPNVAPPGYEAPRPIGRIPNDAWDEEFTTAVTSLTDAELEKQILSRLTLIIHEETQRDGYELRKLNFEGKPLEELPERRIIEYFVFEEETMRERVVEQVVETDFRLTPTSEDRAQLKTVENIIGYIKAYVISARKPDADFTVTDAVRDVLAAQPVQPSLGFHHALPQETRSEQIVEWERLHHSEWQFGNAVYTPRDKEKTRGNLNWMREEEDYAERSEFQNYVKSGQALKDHKERIRRAAEQ